MTQRTPRTELISPSYVLESSAVAILPHPVPLEASAVHRDVDAGRERLHERQRAAQVEQSVRASERVRNHRAGQDDRLPVPSTDAASAVSVSTMVSVPCVIR